MNPTQRSRQAISGMLMDPGVIAVVRGQEDLEIVSLCEALVAGGITAIEITLTTPNAIGMIRQAGREMSGRALIGVGTVLDAASCDAAIEAGAEFVVTPVTRTSLIARAHAAEKPVMIGAYTPTEARLAWEAGADFIKIFPADTLGPRYIKSLLAPFPQLRCVPTGGIDLDNLAAFLEAGCVAVGVGSSLAPPKMLQAGDWTGITQRAAAFVQVARSARS